MMTTTCVLKLCLGFLTHIHWLLFKTILFKSGVVPRDVLIFTLYTSRHVTDKSYSSGKQAASSFVSVNNVM